MSKPGKRGGRTHLSDDDHDLWSHTARSVAPLKKAKPRVPDVAAEDVEPGTEARLKAPDGRHRAATAPKVAPDVPAKTARAKPKPGPFDAKAERKLRAGREEIEARIDLHGMRQAEAHAALRRFLQRAQARGQRFVLVITGKGAPAGARWDDAAAAGREERGVIRRNVPLWLTEPDLAAIVVSYTPAAPRHGGNGALYVHLRNPERAR